MMKMREVLKKYSLKSVFILFFSSQILLCFSQDNITGMYVFSYDTTQEIGEYDTDTLWVKPENRYILKANEILTNTTISNTNGRWKRNNHHLICIDDRHGIKSRRKKFEILENGNLRRKGYNNIYYKK